MLSYKQWKLLNENFGLVSMGVKSHNTVAITGNNLELDEAKKMKKKMLDDEKVPMEDEPEEVEDDEEEDVPEEKPEEDCCDDDEDADDEAPEEKEKITMPIMGMKKKMKKKMKKESTETEEKVVESNPLHDQWRISVKNWLNPDVPQKNWDGMPVKEDALLPPSEEQAPAPKPGELGYAPVGRIGGSWLS